MLSMDTVDPINKIAKLDEADYDPETLNKETFNEENDSAICESCGLKMKNMSSSGEVTNMCSSCIKIEKEKCDKYEESNCKSCEHCKTTTLDKDHKMLGCLICGKFYHVNCLLPGDFPSDLVFKAQQLIRRKLGCIHCAVVHLCYKVHDVVTWRWRAQAQNVTDPGKYFMPREFLVHYRLLSYWDCEWVSELQFEMSESQLYRCYKRRSDFTLPPSPAVLSDGHRRKMSTVEVDLHDKFVKWGVNAEWLQPHRVLTTDEVGCVVKWRGLGYDFLSTEPLSRASEIPGLQEAVDRYNSLKQQLLQAPDGPADKSRLAMISESPEYLGPPGGAERPRLHPYQLEGLNWLRSSYSNDVNTILADEMGLGKTIQAIAFLSSLFQEEVSRGPFIVVVPLSTMKNWEREFEYWAPDLCVLCYYGDKDCRVNIRDYLYFTSKKRKVPSFHVLLTTYELIYVDESFLHTINWEILIIDEAHRIKNNQSKLFKSFKKYKIKYRNLMTGTPLQNNLEELFHLLNFMEPQSFGNLAEFLSQFQDVSKEDQVKTLQEMLKKHILRRVKMDVMSNLPIKEEQIIRLDLTNLQKDLYKMILTKNFDYLGGKFSSLRMTNIMMQLRKVCNHPYLVMSEVESQMKEDGGYDVPALVAASGKMELLQKMLLKLRATGHRVLIFSGMTKLLDIMEYMLDDLAIQYERIDGNISSASRQSAIDRFNDPSSESLVFLLSTKAGGLGINLTSADTVIIYDADWNPHNDIQALSRAHRIGQRKKVMIYRFVTRNSVEEKIMEAAKRKMMVTNLVVKTCSKMEFHQILSFGTKELFDENASDHQKILYDDAAIETLLDRDRTEEARTDRDLLDTCFSGFKVADCQYATEAETHPVAMEISVPPSEGASVVTPECYWTTLLAPHVRVPEEAEEDLPQLGKGLRLKKKLFFEEPHMIQNKDDLSDASDQVTVDEKEADTDFSVSAGEEEAQAGASSEEDGVSEEGEVDGEGDAARGGRSGLERDWRRLTAHGIIGDAARQVGLGPPGGERRAVDRYNKFAVVEGFLPVERMDVYTALMNHGLPPRVARKSDLWWPPALLHKTQDEMNKFLQTIMAAIVENAETNRFPEAVPKDNIDYDLLLARIGLNALIAFKVNQYEVQNKFVLETLAYKQVDVHTQSVPEIEEVFAELKEAEFEFEVYEGGLAGVRAQWAVPGGPVCEWGRLHDYVLLSAMAQHGYDRYLDLVFQDPRLQVLLLPAKARLKLDCITNNHEVRRAIRARQVLLERALLLEAQLLRLVAVSEDAGVAFCLEGLRRVHDLLAGQPGPLSVPQAVAGTRGKLRAIAQLEQLINDVDDLEGAYRTIEVRRADT